MRLNLVLPLLLAVVSLALSPSAVAQVIDPAGPAHASIGLEIREPQVVIPPQGRNVTLDLVGLIACNDGAERPDPVVVVTGMNTQTSRDFYVEEAEKTVDWEEEDTLGWWRISAELTFHFGTALAPDASSHRTNALFTVRDQESDTGCTPNGYVLYGDRDVYTAIVPALEQRSGDVADDPSPRASTGPIFLGVLAGLVLGAVLMAVMQARMRRPPS